MKNAQLTSGNILDIIRTCNRNRVLSFELGGLKIQFDGSDEIASSPKRRRGQSSPAVGAETTPADNNPDQLELREIEEEMARFDAEQLSLTDPVEFERIQIEGESK